MSASSLLGGGAHWHRLHMSASALLGGGGSFAHLIRLLNYLFVNLVSVQISPGDRNTLSIGGGGGGVLMDSVFISDGAKSN